MYRFLLGVITAVLIGGCGSVPQQGPVTHYELPTAPVSQTVLEAPRLELASFPHEPSSMRLEWMQAPVVPLTPEGGKLVPPSDPKVLGWWGSKVGAKQGATLLVGHTVHTGGGTFDRLEEVAVGSDVNVSGVHYTVRSVNIISKAELARRASHLFSQRGSHRLVLVTCEDYDPSTGHYASNVVVVAK